jgi:hypothetical protein
VQKLSEQVESLQQTNIVQQQTHEKDVQLIGQLQQKLAETQQIATNAEQKSIEASRRSRCRGSPLTRPPSTTTS